MSAIVRVIDFKGFAPAPDDFPGPALKLVARASRRPRYAIVGGDGRWHLFHEKPRRDGISWRVEVPVDWCVGTVRLTVELDGVPHDWQTEVLPDRKLFPDARAAVDRLITRLVEAHAHLPWGTALAGRAGDLDEATDGPAPPALHLAALDAWMPRLHRALGRVERLPIRALVAGRATVPLDRATRSDARTQLALARRPAWAAALREGLPHGGRPSLDVPVVSATVSHPANRALRGELGRLDRAMRDAIEAVQRWRATQSKKAQWAEADRLIAGVERHRAALAKTLRRPPWRDLRPAEGCPTAQQVFADDPVYAEAAGAVRRLTRPAVRPRIEGLIDAHLRPAYDLWEQYVWCRVVRVVRAALGSGWRWTAPPVAHNGLAVGPADGSFATAARDGWTVAVGSQIRFRSASRHAAKGHAWHRGRVSLNLTRRPDTLITVRGPAGLVGWLVLDAKYCAARYPIEADHLPVTHHYKDGLRFDGRPPDAAFIVVPALEDEARCYAGDDFRDAFGTGAIVDASLVRLPGEDRLLDDYRPVVRWLETHVDLIGRP